MADALKHDWKFEYCHPHNGEYWYKCSICGASDWIANYGTVDQLDPKECKPAANKQPWSNVTREDVCIWVQDSDGSWHTACNKTWEFIDGGPGENGGCGTQTHVVGTNGGTMPCGSLLTQFGKTSPYYCVACAEELAKKEAL